MSEAKHTPGEWFKANGNRHYGFSIYAPGDRPGGRKLICETIGIDTIELGRNRYEEGPVTIANACLLEAAPDLLAACRDCLAVVDEAYQATSYIRVAHTSEQRLKIEAAIAKALGN